MSRHDRELPERAKQARKKMRAHNRALELHLEINGKPKNPGHASLLAKLNAERAKFDLPTVTEPPGFNQGKGKGRPGR